MEEILSMIHKENRIKNKTVRYYVSPESYSINSKGCRNNLEDYLLDLFLIPEPSNKNDKLDRSIKIINYIILSLILNDQYVQRNSMIGEGQVKINFQRRHMRINVLIDLPKDIIRYIPEAILKIKNTIKDLLQDNPDVDNYCKYNTTVRILSKLCIMRPIYNWNETVIVDVISIEDIISIEDYLEKTTLKK